MSDLPPDAARLRVVLRWLEQQIADNDTIGVYLRLQLEAVQRALDEAQGGPSAAQEPRPAPDPPAIPVVAPAPRPRRAVKPFLLERRRTPDGPLPIAVHTADCHMAGDQTHAVNAMEARLALTDSGLTACQFCRPDLELGLDASD